MVCIGYFWVGRCFARFGRCGIYGFVELRYDYDTVRGRLGGTGYVALSLGEAGVVNSVMLRIRLGTVRQDGFGSVWRFTFC
jgi:hypothetical protein